MDGDTINIVENRKRLLGNSWYHIPKPLLLNVFQYLCAPDLIKAGRTCSTWNQISSDELLWRDLLRTDFGVDTSVGLRPGMFLADFHTYLEIIPDMFVTVHSCFRANVMAFGVQAFVTPYSIFSNKRTEETFRSSSACQLCSQWFHVRYMLQRWPCCGKVHK